MKPEWRRFAPIGLYIALLAALVSAGLFIVMREWNLWLQISLGLIVVGLAVFVILDPERVRQNLTGRQARYGSNALILTIAFLGILVVVNYLVLENSQRWDLTEDKEFTLTDDTIKTLKELPEEIHAQAFFSSQVSPDQAGKMLEQFKFHADGKFDYEFIDPVAEPVIAEQAGISRDGSVVMQMGENKEIVDTISEQGLVTGLARLVSPEVRAVYFLTGHGEYNIDVAGDQSYSSIKRILESKNYKVENLNLLATNQIPDDAKVVVVVGPQKPVSQAEVDRLAAFVQAGGGLMVLEEPILLTQFEDDVDPLAEYLAESWGIILGNDLIIDQTSPQPFIAIASEWGNHITVQNLRGFNAALPTARSVSVGAGAEGASVVTLASTALNAWAETDMEALQTENAQLQADPGEDIFGPVPIAAAGENFETEARVVVFGDADFGIDANFRAYANADLFTNSVDWAAGEEERMDFTPKETTARTIIPPQKYALNLIMLLTVFVLPGLALLGSVLAFIQKRRRG
ncbi:GldG family protein [Chloroflexota bacterium]